MQSSDPGPSIPGFQIVEIAGRGGMGTVYRAEQAAPRREVALKVLNRAHVDEISLAAFRREAEIIAGLEHPRIVPLYTYGEHEGVPYLVLRYLPGGSVADRLERGPVELADACTWIASVAEALEFSHETSMLHRDIKPSNILLDDSGNAYLTDFGIATALEAAGESDQALGSAPYMAPEQIRGEPLDGQADLYALAATLFEMLTGEVPYPAESAVGMRMRHLHDPVPSARERNPQVPPAFDDFLRRGLAKQPDRRFSGASEFASALDGARKAPQRRLWTGEPDRPVGQTPGGTLVAGVETKENGFPWAALAVGAGFLLVVAVLVVGGAGALWLLRGRGRDTQASATVPPTRAAQAAPPATATPGGRLLADDFSDPESGFAVGGDEDGGVAYREGALSVRVERGGVEWFSPSGRVDRRDVAIEATVLDVEGAAGGHFGVFCRWLNPATYTALALTAEGEAAAWQRRDGELTWLREWAPAEGSGLTVGAGQRLSAVCRQERLRLEVAGQVVSEAIDPSPMPGDVGLMAGAREAGPFVVTFDDFLAAEPRP